MDHTAAQCEHVRQSAVAVQCDMPTEHVELGYENPDIPASPPTYPIPATPHQPPLWAQTTRAHVLQSPAARRQDWTDMDVAAEMSSSQHTWQRHRPSTSRATHLEDGLQLSMLLNQLL